MSRALAAGAAFFGLVFGLGFLLGALRHLLMGYGLSRGVLVAAEIPLMLAFAWWAAGWCAERFGTAISASARLVMGGVMLTLLRVGELGVGMAFMGQTAASHVAALLTAPGLLEAAPQVLAALFPLVRANLFGR
jgi:hypothetical protein